MDRVLVVAAHPDDEVLGPGGTILRHVEQGDTVHVHLACCHGLRDAEARLADARRVSNIMGTTLSVGYLAQLSTTVREARDVAERLVRETAPDIVYTHHPGDLNADHRALSEAVAVACRPHSSTVRSLRWFETASSTEWGPSAGLPPFLPTLFVTVDASRKAQLMDHYRSEARPLPHPRNGVNLMHRAFHWGSVAGVQAAEAFQLVRETW